MRAISDSLIASDWLQKLWSEWAIYKLQQRLDGLAAFIVGEVIAPTFGLIMRHTAGYNWANRSLQVRHVSGAKWIWHDRTR